jgi:branched-subunit amino acid transport protein
MSAWQSWAVVIGLGLGTFLIRYSFIGLFANRDIPPWLAHGLKFMVPAIFAAIVFSGVAMTNGQLAGLEQWPKFVAALVALAIAVWKDGHMVWTVVSGMLALHLLPWLAALLLKMV